MVVNFVFPFTTCEKPQKDGWVAQPASAITNMITFACLVVATFLARTFPVKFAFGSYAAFEAWHALSHVRHIPGLFQTNVIHVLGTAMSFITLYAILALSRQSLSVPYLSLLLGALAVDTYIWMYVKGIWMFISGLTIFAIIVYGNISLIPKRLRVILPYMAIGLLLLFSLIINEAIYCNRMLAYKEFPYHAIVEYVGFWLFMGLVWIFLGWEKMVKN